MRVSEIISFDQYWQEERFKLKRPNLSGSLMQAFGDNIYHHLANGEWAQEKSVHSYENGGPNLVNVRTDTKTDRVLIATDFAYFGGAGPLIPERFRDPDGDDVCGKRYYRKNLSPELVERFVQWLRSLNTQGFAGEPLDWRMDWATKSFMSEAKRKEVLASRRIAAKSSR
jgi:Nucleotide modification associated domain 2